MKMGLSSCNLSPAFNTIEIRKPGYRTYLTEFAVRQGETTTLNVAMTPVR